MTQAETTIQRGGSLGERLGVSATAHDDICIIVSEWWQIRPSNCLALYSREDERAGKSNCEHGEVQCEVVQLVEGEETDPRAVGRALVPRQNYVRLLRKADDPVPDHV